MSPLTSASSRRVAPSAVVNGARSFHQKRHSRSLTLFHSQRCQRCHTFEVVDRSNDNTRCEHLGLNWLYEVRQTARNLCCAE
jgi:hypothetical protein